ncbi:autotransporter outer membrane beta-barrel domain-containing protein [Methylobacterium aerolatum]|uniref:Outer membrane autotransporter protein n=1 Tax=Methylobacterium aerolatum TaxID=418708 RepID=A0ABU0I761_9HYPH|nr:autotransporter domain-containing protein [Methylobacterium aerolatum]MDQ0449863.1 outer membrane autotransporter protein [Methylobacterium aerolatum]GJD36630.1 hypothetical protein FMGBMHLM_3553 [Methylobacterium aerolatum]
MSSLAATDGGLYLPATKPCQHRRAGSVGVSLIALSLALAASEARAACTQDVNDPSAVACGNTTLGAGQYIGPTQNGTTLTSVTINNGATVDSQSSAISLGDNVTVTIGAGATVHSHSQTAGPTGIGANTIEVGNNATIDVSGALITDGNGIPNSGQGDEVINPRGNGNTIIIRQGGSITSLNNSTPTIWFQNVAGSNSLPNTVTNAGLIQAGDGSGQVVGNSGNVVINFTNAAGGVVNGNLVLGDGADSVTLQGGSRFNGSINMGGGDDAVTLSKGSTIAGNIDGGGGANALTLTGNANDPGASSLIQGSVSNFSSLTKTGTSTWTIAGSLDGLGSNAAVITVDQGTLLLTANNSGFQGSTTINAGGTLQLGNGGTTGSLASSIVTNGTLAFNRSDAVTYGNAIVGTGTLAQNGNGLLTLTGSNGVGSQFTGTAEVNSGILAVNGTFGDTAGNSAVVNVRSGGTLHGSGTIAGSVNVAAGGTVSAGNSPGTLTVAGNYTLAAGSTSLFELGTPGVVGGATNDLINVGGNLTLAGTLSLVSSANAAAAPVAGYYRLYNYGGTLTGGFGGITSPSQQQTYTVQTSIANQVNLIVSNNGQALQFWDGTDTTGAGPGGQGGTATWTGTATNWTGGPTSTINAPWQSGVGIFGGTAGTVTVAGAQNFQGLQFTVDGYVLTGGTLNLTGDPFSTPNQSFVTVDAGVGTTIGSVITSTGGAFGLDKLGAGTLTLTAANTYTGPTSVTQGTLVLASTGSLLSNVAVANGATFQNAGSVAAAVANAGSFTNTGTVAGLTTNSGTLASTGTLAGGLTNSGNAQVSGTVAGPVANTGTIQFTGPVTGITTLANDALVDLGGTALSLGALSGTTASAVLRNGQLTVGSDNTSTTYAGIVADGGSATTLTKVGTGTLTLSGTNSYTGATTVGAGTLNLTGSLASAVTVASGALVTGTGTAGGLFVQSGGAAAPGTVGGLGTLNVAGNVTFAAGSTYRVDANAAGQSDRIAATGTATLQGGLVQVTAGTGQYAPATRYTILTATGGVSGRFAGVTSNFAFLTPSLAYDANNGYLVLTRNDIRFASAAFTRNEANAAVAIEATGLGGRLYNAVAALSAPQARQAFDALSGEIHSSAIAGQYETAYLVREAILDRLRYGQIGTAGIQGIGQRYAPGTTLPTTYSADLPGAMPLRGSVAPAQLVQPEGIVAWGQGFGSFGSVGGNGNAARLDQQTSGFVLGVDTRLDNGWRVGVAGGYTYTALDVTPRQSTGTIETGFGGLYAGTNFDAVQLRLGGTYGGTSLSTRRAVIFPNFGESETARYGGSLGQAFGEVGYRLGSTERYIEPFLGAAAIHIARDSFSERGGVAALTARGRDYDMGTTTVGVQTQARLDGILGQGTPFFLRGLVGYRRAFGDVDPSALYSFGAAAQPFLVSGAPVARNTLVAQGGIDWQVGPSTLLSIAYTGQVGSQRLQDHGVKGSLLVRW